MLISLTRIDPDHEGDLGKPLLVNINHIISIMPHNLGASIALAGMKRNTIVTQTPEEIEDEILELS